MPSPLLFSFGPPASSGPRPSQSPLLFSFGPRASSNPQPAKPLMLFSFDSSASSSPRPSQSPMLLSFGAKRPSAPAGPPPNGAIVAVNRGLYDHVGIYDQASDTVIHKDVGGVVRTTMAQFRGSSSGPVRTYPTSEPATTVARAASRIGETSYNLLTDNCDHFVDWASTGNNRSPQISGTMLGAVGALAGGPGGMLLGLAGQLIGRRAIPSGR
jgi:hypothetical protein